MHGRLVLGGLFTVPLSIRGEFEISLSFADVLSLFRCCHLRLNESLLSAL